MCCLLKTVADDTESLRSTVKPKGAGQNLTPPLPFPQDAKALPFRGLTLLVVGLYHFDMVGRKQNAVFLKMKAELHPGREIVRS